MSKTLLESEAERALINWARNLRDDYTYRLRYKSHSPEQSLAGGSGVDNAERKLELIDALCNDEMMQVRQTDDVMYHVAVLEFNHLDSWIANCRRNKGWRELITGVWHSVRNPYKSHFLEYVKANEKIDSTTYYNKLSRLKKRVAARIS